jgi:FlaA1/EpsC-like NDP-sugar epimerase
MGEPIRIVDLAKTLIQLSGRSEDQIRIVFTGLRPGEKLYEELFYESEEQRPTSQKKVRCTAANSMDWRTLSQHLEDLQRSAVAGTETSIRAKVKEIIPEYRYLVSNPAPPAALPHIGAEDRMVPVIAPAACADVGD